MQRFGVSCPINKRDREQSRPEKAINRYEVNKMKRKRKKVRLYTKATKGKKKGIYSVFAGWGYP